MEDRSARALVGGCLYVAIADREVDRDEKAVLTDRLEQVCPQLSRGAANRLFGQSVADLSAEGHDRFLRRLAEGLAEPERRAVVAAALATAAADGDLGPDEERRLGELAQVFGLPEEEVVQLRRQAVEAPSELPTGQGARGGRP